MVEPPSLVLDDQYALSPMQQGMLFHSLDPRDRGVDVEQVLCSLAEPLDIPRFVQAWESIIARYDILRTSFEWEGRLEPVQNVYHVVDLPVRLVDWRHLPAADQQSELQALVEHDRAIGFDLTSAPLMRLTIASCGPRSFEVLWSFHHAILDGRSFPILLREVFAAYESGSRGAVAQHAPQFRRYIDWLQTRDADTSRAFWTERLRGFIAPTPIFDAVPAGRGTGLGLVEQRLSADESQAVGAFARANDVTVGTLVTGAWALLLSRYTGDADVVFGTTRTCRHGGVDGGDEMVGLLINTVPFRSRIDPQQTVAEWLAEVRAEQIAIRPHEQTPLPKIQAWSDVGRGTPMFETLLVFEKYLLDSVLNGQGGAWANRRFAYQGQTNYPINFICYDDARMVLRIEFDRQRLDEVTAGRMLRHVSRLLTGLAAGGAAKLADVQMLSEDERAELLPVARPSGIQTFCLHERFERRAAETPSAPALTCDGQTWTYDEVNRWANQVAHRLRDLGVGPDVLVGIYTERSPELVIAMLGVLKAGGAYVPLDPAYPGERVKFVLDDAHVSLVVTVRRLLDQLPATTIDVICADEVDDQPAENPQPAAEPDNLAYVIYTSGSTGRPKGVMISHGSICDRLAWLQRVFPMFERDVVLQKTTLTFDASVWEIFNPLAAGAMLVMARHRGETDGDYLVDMLLEHGVTLLQVVPSLLRILVETPGFERCSTMRRLFCGGEAFPSDLLRRARAQLAVDIVNLYGPTECTPDVTFWPCGDERGATVPIGRPRDNVTAYVLDEQLQQVPVAGVGELFIGGACVARGYQNRPALTAERFIPDPYGRPGSRFYATGDRVRRLEDGVLEFIGRGDHQVKIRGYRIELQEIEACLAAHPAVAEAAVIASDAVVAGDQRLAAYVVFRVGQGASPADLRTYVSARLPPFMVPAAFAALDAFPLHPNGKVNRLALPEPRRESFAGCSEIESPVNAVEALLERIWSDVLQVPGVSRRDNFFDLGGDSLLMTQAIGRLSAILGRRIPLQLFFEQPRLMDFALTLMEGQEQPGEIERLAANASDTVERQADVTAHR